MRRLSRDRRTAPASAADAAEAEHVLAALAVALDAPPERSGFTLQRTRIAGRSNIYVVTSGQLVRGHSAWVVKQPHTSWTQRDVGPPIDAFAEFTALGRLHRRFQETSPELRVPEPVGYLPTIDAFVMEYLPGPTLRDFLGFGDVLRPGSLRTGLRAAARFLRHLHGLEELESLSIDLREEAERVLDVTMNLMPVLEPSALEVVTEALEHVPHRVVTYRPVWLHGDFGPTNIILATGGGTAGVDASLSSTGPAEQDLARFVATMCGAWRFAPETVARPAAALRHTLVDDFLGTYGASTPSALFELRLLEHLVGRWHRLRELAAMSRSSRSLPPRLRLIDAQMIMLMRESAARLTAAVDHSP